MLVSYQLLVTIGAFFYLSISLFETALCMDVLNCALQETYFAPLFRLLCEVVFGRGSQRFLTSLHRKLVWSVYFTRVVAVATEEGWAEGLD